jgi:hypothetical protein
VVALDAEPNAMTLTYAGRVQTRLLLILIAGLPWTCLIAPVLAAAGAMSVPAAYRLTLTSLAVMAGLGVLWDGVYYALQQLRWDKDWPSSFALLNALNEAPATWLALSLIGTASGAAWLSSPPAPLFAIHFLTTWLLMWLAAQGPLRVLFPRWRFNGGSLSRS